ncbi:MAG: hypothetical protein R6V49_03420, partial [Bacteroidales bacterium]
ASSSPATLTTSGPTSGPSPSWTRTSTGSVSPSATSPSSACGWPGSSLREPLGSRRNGRCHPFHYTFS